MPLSGLPEKNSRLDWNCWPRASANLDFVNLDRRNYHAYVQWLAAQQVNALNQPSGKTKALLYMDLPVGVHPFSYDIWKDRDSFASGINCGAPPDPVFTNGQNWDFPPLHPQHIRTHGYQYFIQSLRHQLKILRYAAHRPHDEFSPSFLDPNWLWPIVKVFMSTIRLKNFTPF